MNRFINKILFISTLLASPAITVKAICPTAGATVIEVCNDAGGNSTIRAYFFNGDPALSYFLFSITTGEYVSDPLGPVTVDTTIPLPSGAVAGVEFGLVPDGDYIIRVNCSPAPTFVNIGGLGINAFSGNAINAGVTVDADCNPLTGAGSADGSITLNISGGIAPYDITWPVSVTPIANSNGVGAGNHNFPNLDGGAYTAQITDANSCIFTTNIDVPISTAPLAGVDQTVCGPGASLNANAPGPGEIGTWTGPAGVTFTPDANTPNAIANNLSVGLNTLTWTITDIAATCAGLADQVDITSDAPATVDAGAPQTICGGATVTLAGSFGGTATSATWTTSGTGSFDNANSLTAVYTPGPADVVTGTVTLTLTTNDPAGPCISVNDNVVITITASATVEAGPVQTICSNGSATLAGSFAGAATSATWSTSGDGGFNNAALPGAVYTPGLTDITNGTVTLTFTTNDPAGPCPSVNDNVVITIDAVPTVDAGLPQIICSGSTVTLAGVIGGSATGSTWTTSGDGTFNNAGLLAAIYTPGMADLTAGTVTLTLTTNDPAGPCVAVNDNVVITIDAGATVDAGAPQTICTGNTVTLAGTFGGSATSANWTTSGDGTFDDASSPTAIYTPGATDATNGTATLTFTTNDPVGPCPSATDDVIITINPVATVDAGAPQTICSGSTATMAGVIGGSATGSTWTTSGDGTFNNAGLLAAIYTPGTADLTAGTVTLTFTTNDPAGPCVAANDDVVITIDAGATVDAGAPQTICTGSTVTLAGTFGGSATSANWTTSGDGTFDNASSPTAIYTPGATDAANGTATLTFTTNDPVGPCPSENDNVVISIDAVPTVDAGLPQIICSGSTGTLTGVIGGSATSSTWTTSGDGTFNNAGLLAAIYTPGTADLTAGTVTLTLTTNDPAGPCVAVNDDVVITIDAGATVDAGALQTICAGSTATLAGTFGGSATTANWTTSGDGTFDDASSPTAIYTPGATDTGNGTVTLTFTTNDPVGPCPSATDDVIITFNPVATVDAGAPQTICSGSTATMAGVIGGSATTATWTTTGDGTFNDATSITAIYTPGSADRTAGTVTLTLTTDDPAGPCGSVNDNVVITLDPPATVEAGNPQTICSAGIATLAGSSVGGTAITGAWSIVSQPGSGDGLLSDVSQTAAPATVTFSATVTGDYTLRLTTNDPAGICNPVADDVVITVTSVATVDAGSAQIICVGGSATLAGSFTGTTAITWTSPGDGSFNDASLANAVYTPGPNDIVNNGVTLTITTAGPCAPVSDNVVITINPAPTVDAGPPQTVCVSLTVALNASFGGSATGVLWTTSGNGSFDDNTDTNATYTPGTDDITNGTVTLTAEATGSCPGTSDDVIITLNPAAAVDAGAPQTICFGSAVVLDATLSGAATTMTWTTSGDGTFSNNTDPDASYTPGPNDQIAGTATLTATTNNPAGPCPAVNDNVVITFIPIPGDQTTAGTETWIGYVYDDAGDPTPIPAKIDFNNLKYRGFIEAIDIDNMSAASTYNAITDEFDLNAGLAVPIQGPNVCGSYLDNFSIRYKMDKTFTAGIYRFTAGADDGVRLLIDGVNVIPAAAFDFQSYTTYTSAPICLSSGIHAFEIHYFDNNAHSRLSFDYAEVPDLTTNAPVSVCINSAAPALTASSTDPAVVDFNWYKNAVLVFTGASYTPAAAELDMTTAGTTTFTVTAVYACGETPPTDVDVDVLNSATLVITPQTVCESAGVIDLRTLVNESPAGGAFVFSGHPNISGNDFDPSGLAGNTVSISVDYGVGSCTAPQGTLDLTINNTATTTVPATAVVACESSADIDLTTLVSAVPAGGVFSFSGTQVTGNVFDPSGLSGLQTITVDYTIGGCTAPQTTFDIDVAANASVTVNNATACENGNSLNLLTLVSSTPAGGTFNFTGAGVSGNIFDPSGQSGTVNISVDYDFNGCTDSGIIQVTILNSSDPLCSGGNCATVVIIPKPEPATCTNSDGRLVMSIKPFVPTVNNTGVKITIDGISSTGLPISRTIFNDSTFNSLPVGVYDYTIEYGDPSCIKTGQFSIDQSGTVGTPVVSNVISPLCPGSATGSIILDVPGETGNVLEWSLDGGLTDPFKPFTAGTQITGIPAGPPPSFQHVFSVRRNIADVCYSSVTVVVTESVQNITATFNITPATCNGNDGAITNIVAGGGHGGPYTFSINGGQSFQSNTDFNGLNGGTYAVRVRDDAGCENDITASVTFPGFINSSISKNNADCTNDGNSGSISVTVTDPGVFQVALSTDQFNQPPDADYLAYTNPSVAFSQLPRGQYFVYVRSNSTICPTRSAPINIFGVYAINFDIEPDCNNNELSIALVNVTGELGGAPLEIQVSKKFSSDPPEIIYTQFPADGEIYLDYDQHTFLKIPGEYRIRIIQFQNEVVCNLSSQSVDFTVPGQLSAQVTFMSESYPDVPTGKLHVTGFSGGENPYDVRIELDSASSLALPNHVTDFEEAGLDENLQFEMVYNNIPAGRYHVEVMDSLGCLVDLIARVPLDVDLFVPNVFTPNGDGSNDVLFIRNMPPAPSINQLMISNRWGKEVFVSENYQNNWDGEGASDGVYYYKLQIADNDAVTGWIEIIRGPKP